MLRVALTGGIGSGKTTVARMFAQRGVPVVDADEIAHSLIRRGQPAYQDVVNAFGANFLDAAGEIDRQRLGRYVFAADNERQRLEAIVHPRVRREIADRIVSMEAPYCIIVVPLLFESGMQDLADRILVVDSSEYRQIERVRARNGLAEGQIRAIMAAQIGPSERRRRADDVIVNDSDLADLEVQVDRLHDRYRALSTTNPHAPASR